MASTPSSTALAASLTSARVGLGSSAHRLEHLRRDNHRNSRAPRLARDLLLRGRHFLERHLEAEIAARHHDALRHLQNLVEMIERLGPLDLRDQRDVRRADFRQYLARLPHVVRAADEAERHHVDSELRAELEIVDVFRRQRIGRKLDAGRVDPLVLVERAAFEHSRHNFARRRIVRSCSCILPSSSSNCPPGRLLRTSSAYVV